MGEEGRLLIFGTMVVWRILLLSEGEGAFKKKIAKKKKKKKQTNKSMQEEKKKQYTWSEMQINKQSF